MKKILTLIAFMAGLSLYAADVPYQNTYVVTNSSILTVKPVKSIMVIVYTDDNINHKVKPNCDDEGNNCTNEGNNPTNKEVEQFVLSKNNTIEHTCNRSFCVVVDNMMNKYVFDGNNFTNYQFLTTP